MTLLLNSRGYTVILEKHTNTLCTSNKAVLHIPGPLALEPDPATARAYPLEEASPELGETYVLKDG